MMIRKAARPIASFIFVTGLFSIAADNAAQAGECFPGPDFKATPGTEWHYQIDSATKQGCWYLKELGSSSRRRTREVARSSRSVSPSSSSESSTSSSERRSDNTESTPAAPSPQGSLKEWFSSTFTSLLNPSNAYSIEPSETVTTGPGVVPKPSNELSAPRQSQRSKSEPQTKVAQQKFEGQRSETERAPHLIYAASILEAAGDKPVLSPPALQGQELQKALEAVGEKDVLGDPSGLEEDWQKSLWEEFLRWRLRQLISD
ncbi:MAG: hypothetical protein C5B58_05620 [Acidobacteria bacterium]|nr:MAG: hypothetical protein C5B58_05620 [Acidobacteriota bacterium]